MRKGGGAGSNPVFRRSWLATRRLSTMDTADAKRRYGFLRHRRTMLCKFSCASRQPGASCPGLHALAAESRGGVYHRATSLQERRGIHEGTGRGDEGAGAVSDGSRGQKAGPISIPSASILGRHSAASEPGRVGFPTRKPARNGGSTSVNDTVAEFARIQSTRETAEFLRIQLLEKLPANLPHTVIGFPRRATIHY